MKKLCKHCGKEYDWEKGQLNWTKNGPGICNGNIRSDLYCCYECGTLARKEKRTKTCIQKYGVKNTFQATIVKEKIKETNIKKYGVENPNQCKDIQNKSKKTNLEKYGVEHNWKSKNGKLNGSETRLKKYGAKYNFQLKNVIAKSKATMTKKYGVSTYFKSEEYKNRYEEIQQKMYTTKKKNNSFNASSDEQIILDLLLKKYQNVIKQYKSKFYPFDCDFYIPELDLYIEYQGHWTHGKKPYDFDSKEDLEIINKWKNKNTKFYNIAIKIWSIRDPLKRDTAKKNGLNWIEFFNMKEFYTWYKAN